MRRGISTGPPAEPPKVLNFFGALPENPYGSASKMSFCRYSKTLPCRLFDPLLVVNVTSPTCENSALLLNAVTFTEAMPSCEG